jgi:predicted small integral membrane protein
MVAIRLVKTAMVASIALFSLLVSFDNIVDYDTNYEFVRHTLRMDTILPDNPLRRRAVTSPTLWTAAYWAIIALEAVIGFILAFAAWRLARALRAPSRTFNAAKQYAVIGIGIGFLLWFTGVMVVGGEWFQMWQSTSWNGQESAFRFYMTLLAVGIFVSLPDGEIAA